MHRNSIFKFGHFLISKYGFSYKQRGNEGEASLRYPANSFAQCDPQTFSTFPAPSRYVGSRRRGVLGAFSVRPSRLDSSRVTASSAVSQAQVRIDTLATLLASHGTNPTFSREKQCTYSADSLQPPPTTAADVFSPSPLPNAPAPRSGMPPPPSHQALAL